MTLRCCKFCYKLATDEKHSWFCPFGEGVDPRYKSQEGSQGGGESGGSGGGGGPGDRNIPPLPDAPGGGGAQIELASHVARGLAVGQAIELSQLEEKTAMIEHKPALALPSPQVKELDEQGIRNNSVGKP